MRGASLATIASQRAAATGGAPARMGTLVGAARGFVPVATAWRGDP